MDNKEEEIRKKGRTAIVDALNDILKYAIEAEEEVINPDKYWKASDALNRLLIKIRRRKDSLTRKIEAVQKELDAFKKEEQEKKEAGNPSENKMDERFDKREERMNPSDFEDLDRQCWNFK